jgi:hypothetical protein
MTGRCRFLCATGILCSDRPVLTLFPYRQFAKDPYEMVSRCLRIPSRNRSESLFLESNQGPCATGVSSVLPLFSATRYHKHVIRPAEEILKIIQGFVAGHE